MTNCNNCDISVFKVPLERVNPKGENGIFWCLKCIQKNEPELYKNIKEDETEVEKTLKKVLYN